MNNKLILATLLLSSSGAFASDSSIAIKTADQNKTSSNISSYTTNGGTSSSSSTAKTTVAVSGGEDSAVAQKKAAVDIDDVISKIKAACIADTSKRSAGIRSQPCPKGQTGSIVQNQYAYNVWRDNGSYCATYFSYTSKSNTCQADQAKNITVTTSTSGSNSDTGGSDGYHKD